MKKETAGAKGAPAARHNVDRMAGSGRSEDLQLHVLVDPGGHPLRTAESADRALDLGPRNASAEVLTEPAGGHREDLSELLRPELGERRTDLVPGPPILCFPLPLRQCVSPELMNEHPRLGHWPPYRARCANARPLSTSARAQGCQGARVRSPSYARTHERRGACTALPRSRAPARSHRTRSRPTRVA